MAAFLIPAGIFLARLATGQLVKYASKRAAESAVKNIGGKIIKKTTEKTFNKAINPSKLKNNPTLKEKIKAQIGIKPNQTKTMPRPGLIDQKKGIAVGKLSQTAYKRQKQGKALLAGTALYEAGKLMGDKDDGAKADTKDKRTFMQKYVLGSKFQPKKEVKKEVKKETKKEVKSNVKPASDKKVNTNKTKKGLSPFEKAFAKARADKKSSFKFKTKDGEKTFNTKLKESPKKKNNSPKTMRT
tara:strand:+ start:354 stop:1079 length:726 start_codon:yes stop_codon:yes gene_type:complete